MLILIDGPHHVGKTTLVEECCPGLAQPKNPRPELLESNLRPWVDRYADSSDIAVFDHFTLFTHPVKAACRNDERFFREYTISQDTLDWVEDRLRRSLAAGKTLIVHASLPEHMLPGQEQERSEFYKVFESWPHLFYDWTNPEQAALVKQAIREFIGG